MRTSSLKCFLSVCFFVYLLSSCSDDENPVPSATVYTYKVAVLMEQAEQGRWERTAQWALANIAEAQLGMDEQVKLQLVFHDQNADDIDAYMRQIAEDTTIVAIIGPTTSACAKRMARVIGERTAYHKPMITTTATDVEYQRQFAGVPYVWNLAESDIAELEVLLSGIASYNENSQDSIMLLTSDSDGGDIHNVYSEWFGFIAEEYGLKISGVHFYKTTDDVRSYVRKFYNLNKRIGNILLFNPSDTEMALAFDDELGKMKTEYYYMPYVYCTDAFMSDVIAANVCHANYEGVDLYASPESGFNQAYHQRFGENVVNGEAQFYDAICMMAYAATLSQCSGKSLNDAILSVVDGRDGKGRSWLPADMNCNFSLLSQGITPDIDGVSSSWTFDEKNHASVCGSTYRHWKLYDGHFLTTSYVSTDGSNRTSSSKNMWDWTASRLQTFSTSDSNLIYPALDDRWALLIAASGGWKNYRFQADVFAMYQLLKQHGYNDDHIVLIVEDDVANHKSNPFPGTLRISDTGDNLYVSTAVDYKLSDLTPNDIADILQGKRSDRLAQVLSPDADDNVLIFWSGHGSPGKMDFGDSQSMSYRQMREILTDTPHRKLLFSIESCYSGGLGEYCQGIPGMLFITAANPYETSHADVWSEQMGVYLSNGFTRGFQEAITSNPSISFRDLYYTLARNTAGSHVKVYNERQYGSIYGNTMGDYLSD